MDNNTLQAYLKMVGMRHTVLGEFWADLMNESKTQIIGWLLENGVKDMNKLQPYLRQNQIATMTTEK